MFFQRQEKIDYKDDPGQQTEGNKSIAGPILVDVQHLARVEGLKQFSVYLNINFKQWYSMIGIEIYVIHVIKTIFNSICILYLIYSNNVIFKLHGL